MCMGVLPACMSMFHMCAWGLWILEEDAGFPGTGIDTDVSHHTHVENLGLCKSERS